MKIPNVISQQDAKCNLYSALQIPVGFKLLNLTSLMSFCQSEEYKIKATVNKKTCSDLTLKKPVQNHALPAHDFYFYFLK